MEFSTMVFQQMQEIEYLENTITQQASRYEKELKYAKDACKYPLIVSVLWWIVQNIKLF
jgi:hypothetical protein